MSQFFEFLESRALFSASPHVKALPTATQVADLQAITDVKSTIAQDLAARTQTLRGDLALIPATRASDVETIREDIARIRVDRGNVPQVRADDAQLRTDRVKFIVDVHTAQVTYITAFRDSNLQLATDRAMLSAAVLKYRSDVVHHI